MRTNSRKKDSILKDFKSKKSLPNNLSATLIRITKDASHPLLKKRNS